MKVGLRTIGLGGIRTVCVVSCHRLDLVIMVWSEQFLVLACVMCQRIVYDILVPEGVDRIC